MSRLPEEFGGPSLDVQIRSAQPRDDELAEAFRAFLRKRGAVFEEAGRRPSVVTACTGKAYGYLTGGALTRIPTELDTWRIGGGATLNVKLALIAMSRQVPAVPDALVELLVDACRAVHAVVPLEAVLIGEEQFTAARLIDGWGTSWAPAHGAPGTLWPEPDGELTWFPYGPIDLGWARGEE